MKNFLAKRKVLGGVLLGLLLYFSMQVLSLVIRKGLELIPASILPLAITLPILFIAVAIFIIPFLLAFWLYWKNTSNKAVDITTES